MDFNRVKLQYTDPVDVHTLTTGKNNGFPFLDILGYLKNTQRNPKFGRVRQVLIWELGWEFPGWDLSHFTKFGIFMGIFFKYPKTVSKGGNPLFFPVYKTSCVLQSRPL